MAPATSPDRPATITALWFACALATPMMRLEVESTPSFAPRTAARNHPSRPVTCVSGATLPAVAFTSHLFRSTGLSKPERIMGRRNENSSTPMIARCVIHTRIAPLQPAIGKIHPQTTEP